VNKHGDRLICGLYDRMKLSKVPVVEIGICVEKVVLLVLRVVAEASILSVKIDPKYYRLSNADTYHW